MNLRDAQVTAVIQRYHDLMASDESLAAQTHERLIDGMRRQHLAFADRALCNVLRPHFISASAHGSIMRHAARMIRMLVAICDRLAGDGELRGRLGLPEHVERLAELDSDARVPVAAARVDGLLDEGFQMSFIEYNPTPGGIAYTVELASIFRQTPVMQRMMQEFSLSSPSALDALAAATTAGGARPNIAFVEFHYEKMAAEIAKVHHALEGRGVAVSVASFEDEWVHRDGRLTVNGRPIDLVAFLNPLVAARLLSVHGASHPIFEAIRARSAHALNGLFRSALLFSKVLIALLSDPAAREVLGLDPAEGAEGRIPWTRLVRDSTTVYRGREIDLLPFLADHREQFVLKIGDGFAGEGIVLGWEQAPAAWVEALAHARAGGWVVQERVRMPTLTYPVMRDGEVCFEEFYSDICPFVWNDSHAQGYLVRLAQNRLLNISAGNGSVTPLFVVHD